MPKDEQVNDISIVIPIYNEEESISFLYRKLLNTLTALNRKYEIIFVDDGSTDGSLSILEELRKKDNALKIIKFGRNYGQTAAIDAGFKAAQGEVVVTMDGDLQNDPADIPRLLDELKKGFDCISGWRFPRKDSLMRRLLSWLADKLRRFILKDGVHDSGCTLKVFRRECLIGLNLYGDMHRFIPAILQWRGFKIGEVKVSHYYRIYGKTKYRLGRIFRGLVDLLILRLFSHPAYKIDEKYH